MIEKYLQYLTIFFSNIVSNLNIPQYEDPSTNLENIVDPLEEIREKYKNHPSILAILNQNFNNSFSFKSITKEEIEKEILNLDISKASQQSDIPTKIIKMNLDMFSELLYKEFNKTIETSKYSPSMKIEYVTPIYKKGADQ